MKISRSTGAKGAWLRMREVTEVVAIKHLFFTNVNNNLNSNNYDNNNRNVSDFGPAPAIHFWQIRPNLAPAKILTGFNHC